MCNIGTQLAADRPGYLELCGVLNLIKVDSTLICQVVKHIACLLSFLTTLLEPASTYPHSRHSSSRNSVTGAG